jgi:AAA15 family ATPase/GTPase
MLNRIHIQGFKSLRDATVELAPLVVLFGPNAAGKSNLLEALLLLSRLVGERTLSEAFAEVISDGSVMPWSRLACLCSPTPWRSALTFFP